MDLGKTPTTSEERLDFLVQPFERVGAPDLLPVGVWERRERRHVISGVVQYRLDAGNWRPSITAITPLLADGGGCRQGEDGPDGRGDHLARPLEDLARDVAQEITRHRCQAAPSSTEPIAVLSPACASEITSYTSRRPHSFSDRRNKVQNAPSSLSRR